MRLDRSIAQLPAIGGAALNDEAGDLERMREATRDVGLFGGVQAGTAKPLSLRR